MAILIEGMKCSLCSRSMTKSQATVSFSPFVSNEADPLFRFSDGVFHKECFQKEPLAEMAKARCVEVREQSIPENRRCRVCGKTIVNPDDYLPLGHLTNDRLHPLYQFNYTHLHRSCLHQWPDLGRVTDLAEKHLETGAWKGNGMRWILKALKSLDQKG